MRKGGVRKSRLPCMSSLSGCSEMGVSNHSLGRWGSIKSVGWILENEDGVAGAGLEPVSSANSKVGFSFGFRPQGFLVVMNDWPKSSKPTKNKTLNACLCLKVRGKT